MKSLNQNVWELIRRIPEGKVTTYKIIAEKLGTKAYRAVGTACAKNPEPIRTPCHRVINSDGKIGNYSGKGGINEKIRLLKKEGVEIKNKVIDMSEIYHWSI